MQGQHGHLSTEQKQMAFRLHAHGWRLIDIAKEIGWNPNGAARALSGAASNTIGIALRRPARILGIEPFFMELNADVELAPVMKTIFP